jgi:acyl carrier protein phosphodiesterase
LSNKFFSLLITWHTHICLLLTGNLLGNLTSDFIKGKKKFDYPPVFKTGLALHRAIDAFTDTHEATREAKEFFRLITGYIQGAVS